MPIQAPSWTEFLTCPICCNEFAVTQRVPISLGCGHTICRLCLITLHNRQCPFDQAPIISDIDHLPVNFALLQLVSNGCKPESSNGVGNSNNLPNEISQEIPHSVRNLSSENLNCYQNAKSCIEELALYLKTFHNNGNLLTRPMQRKLVSLVNCQLIEEEGRLRALRAARSLGERTVTELILQHQNSQQLSSNLWAAVRSRGCQFLGPAMQEEVLKLVLLALEDGSALSRKVLVMFVVQRLEPQYPQASKTSIGHVVQLLYRASCFKVSKREADSSLMQLKEEFRTYDSLRREHDAQIVQIATEAGLRIAPEQWSSLLYGDVMHKSHMQSIIDKLQTPSSFAQSVQELVIALQRTNDPASLANLASYFKYLANIDPCGESTEWTDVANALEAVKQVVAGLVQFLQHHGNRKSQECIGGGQNNTSTKYKISLCRDLTVRRMCPRGSSCTFAHSEEEQERFRAKNRNKHLKQQTPSNIQVLMHSSNVKKNIAADEANHQNKGPIPTTSMRFTPQNCTAKRNFMDGLNPNAVTTPTPFHQNQMYRPSNNSISSSLSQPTQFESINNNNINCLTPTVGAMSNNHSPRCSSPREMLLLPHPMYQNHKSLLQRNLTTVVNPPNFNSNNSIPSHVGRTNLSCVIPTDVYQNNGMFYGKETTNKNHQNNVESNFAKPNHGNAPWEQYQQNAQHQLLSPIVSPMNHIGTSIRNSNPNRTTPNISSTVDTSFFTKKPPNTLRKEMEHKKSELAADAINIPPALMGLQNIQLKDNISELQFWDNTSDNSATTKITQNSIESGVFRDRDAFVRSDSILDDDASTFDVPTNSSLLSKFGPICPKYKINNSPTGTTSLASFYNTWSCDKNSQGKSEHYPNDRTLLTSDITFPAYSVDSSLQSETELKKLSGVPEINFSSFKNGDNGLLSNDNDNCIKKNSAACDRIGPWSKTSTNFNSNSNSNASSNYWCDGYSGIKKPSASLNEFQRKQQQLLQRRPQLASEDSFEGGIDTGKMLDLEKELVEIVEVWSNADDSGIKLE